MINQMQANYVVENEITHHTEVLKSNCDYNDAYILV